MEQATLLVSLFGIGSAVGGVGGGLLGQIAYKKVPQHTYSSYCTMKHTDAVPDSGRANVGLRV